jgi:EAL domain-containing protein (putative c-di-GMP-specific phosphodiesterase class I)
VSACVNGEAVSSVLWHSERVWEYVNCGPQNHNPSTYLKRFPVDVLKIDQSFVRDMLADKSDAAIIEAIVKLAQALGLELVAEGVETQEQSAALQSFGCQVMQGYLYSRPVPFIQFCALLDSGKFSVR